MTTRQGFSCRRAVSPFLLASASLLLLAPRTLLAQAKVTASRDVSIDVYAGVTTLSPHFGPDRDKFGYMAGGDIDKYFHYFDVALEGRYTSATGTYADESSILGGLRVGRQYRRFHPYIDFMAGHGNIKFDHPELLGNPYYTHDDSTVYDGGIGLDYNLSRRFAIKVDAQVQRWRTGLQSQVFNPNNISVGLVYHIPYRYLRPTRY